MNSEITTLFRFCVEADLQAVQQLVNDLYASDPNVSDLRPDIALTFLELSRKPEKGRLVVFEKDSQIIGYCIAIFFWSNEYAGNIVEIDELYISEHHRGSGIGTALFKWLKQTFADHLAGFSLQVAHHNKDARRLYEKLGFLSSRNEHMIRIIPALTAVTQPEPIR